MTTGLIKEVNARKEMTLYNLPTLMNSIISLFRVISIFGLIYIISMVSAGAQTRFPLLKSTKLSKNFRPASDEYGVYVDFKEEQEKCTEWVRRCVLENNLELLEEIEPGFDHTLFGQIILTAIHFQESEKYDGLPIALHCLQCLRSDPNPFDLGNFGRGFADNRTSQFQTARFVAVRLGKFRKDFHVRGDVTNQQ